MGGGGGSIMPYMDLERSTFYIDYEALSAVGERAELN